MTTDTATIRTCEDHLGQGLEALITGEGATDIRIRQTRDGECSGCDRPAVWSLAHTAN